MLRAFLLALGLIVCSPFVWAQVNVLHHPPRVAQSSANSSQQAGAIAQKQYGGKVLSVKLRQGPARNGFYEVKLLVKGRVRVVRILAAHMHKDG